jgi:nitrile hydratase accessory protein
LSPPDGKARAAIAAARPDPVRRPELAAALARQETGPVFAEAWQARAFALAMLLCERGCFSAGEWTAELAARRRGVAPSTPRGEQSRYYRGWVRALETLAVRKRLAAPGDLAARRRAWAAAYRRTPHGHPIELPPH